MSEACLVLTIGCESITLGLGCSVASGVVGASDAPVNGVTPQSNGGVSAYPTLTVYTIGAGTTRIVTAAANFDSVRMFGASPEILPQRGQFGRIENETDFMIDLYPVAGKALWQDNVQLAIDTPATLGARGWFNWFVDASGDLHVRA